MTECTISPPCHIPSSPKSTTCSAPSSGASSRGDHAPRPEWEEAGFVPRECAARDGRARLPRPAPSGRYGGSGMDALALGGARRGARPLHLRRLRHHRARPHRHGEPAPGALRHQAQLDTLPAKIIAGETITAVARHRARRRLRRRRHPHPRACATATTSCSTAPRCSSPTACMATSISSRPRPIPPAKGSRGITMFIVEKGTPGFRVGRALDKTGWLSLRHRRAGVRGLPRAGREPARRGEPRLLRDHAQLPERAAGDGRHGDGRGREAHRAHPRLRQDQRTAFGGTLWDKQAIRQRLSRWRPRSRPARQLVHHAAWLDAQGSDCVREVSMVKALCRRAGQRGDVRLRAVPRRRGLHARQRHRAHGARRPRPGDRRRRHGGDAGGSGQAVRPGLVRLKAGKHGAGAMTETEPRYWDDYEVGRKYPLGSTTFTEQEIIDFARQFDPQGSTSTSRPRGTRCSAASSPRAGM